MLCYLKGISYMYAYILLSFLNLPPTYPHPTPHTLRSSQSTKLSFLCYTAAFHQLCALHMVVYTCQCYSLPEQHTCIHAPPSSLLPCVHVFDVLQSDTQANYSIKKKKTNKQQQKNIVGTLSTSWIILCKFFSVWNIMLCMLCSVAQSCPTLHNFINYSLPGSSVQGIIQERILEQVAISSCRGSYHSAIKRNEFESGLVRWMNLKPIIPNEVSQKDKNKKHTLTHIYGL